MQNYIIDVLKRTRPLDAMDQNHNLQNLEREKRCRCNRSALKACALVVASVGSAIVLSHYLLFNNTGSDMSSDICIGRDEHHNMTETLKKYKHDMAEKNITVAQLEERVNGLKARIHDQEAALAKKDKRIDEFIDEQARKIEKLHEECYQKIMKLKDCDEAKELAKLQGKSEEAEKNAMKTFVAQEDKLTQKEKDINDLLKKNEKQFGQLKDCKYEKEKWYEKYSECSNKLSKTWF